MKLRNGIGIALLAAVALLLTSCNMNGDSYTSEAQGYGGKVSVTLTVKDDKITALSAMGADETPRVGGEAITTLNNGQLADYIGQSIQTVDFDTLDAISGATITVNAVSEALEMAKNQALAK